MLRRSIDMAHMLLFFISKKGAEGEKLATTFLPTPLRIKIWQDASNYVRLIRISLVSKNE